MKTLLMITLCVFCFGCVPVQQKQENYSTENSFSIDSDWAEEMVLAEESIYTV